MKAPEKIYVEVCEDGIFAFEKPPFEESIEYIRKNALLEWAKECFRLQDEGRWYSKGAADAFSKVIDKLNSM